MANNPLIARREITLNSSGQKIADTSTPFQAHSVSNSPNTIHPLTQQYNNTVGKVNGTTTTTATTTEEPKKKGGWLSNVLKGGIFGSIGSNVGTTRALYESGQGARTQQNTELYNQAKSDVERWTKAIEEEKAAGNDYAYAQNALEEAQRRLDAYGTVVNDKVQEKATKSTSELSNSLTSKSAEYTQSAKANLGNTKLGNIATDLAVQGVQLGGDIASNVIMPLGSTLSLASRSFGSAAQEAEANGASIGQQLMYGSAKAGVEVLTEKLFDGLAGAYGKGSFDDAAEDIIKKWAKTDAGRKVLSVAFSGAEEASEEVLSNLADPFIKMIYDKGDYIKSLKDPEERKAFIQDTLYSALIGGLMGSVGGTVKVARDGTGTNTGTTPTNPLVQNDIAQNDIAQNDTVQTPKVDVGKAVRNKDITTDNGFTYRVTNENGGNARIKITTSDGQVITQKVQNGANISNVEMGNIISNMISEQVATTNEQVNTTQENAINNNEISTQTVGDTNSQVNTQNATETVKPSENQTTEPTQQNTTENTTELTPKQAVENAKTSPVELRDGHTVRWVNDTAYVIKDGKVLVSASGSGASDIVSRYIKSRGLLAETKTKKTEKATPTPQIANVENATRVEAEMKPKKPETKERGSAVGVKNDTSMTQEIRQYYEDNIDEYEPQHNKDTLRDALDTIEKAGSIDAAVNEVQRRMGKNEDVTTMDKVKAFVHGERLGLTASDVPLIKILANEMSQRGNVEGAHQLLSDLLVEATKAGQFIQAFHILRNIDSPIVAKMAVDKWLAQTNKQIEKRFGKYGDKYKYTAKLTEEETERLKTLDYSNEDEYKAFIHDVAVRIGREMPSTFGQKFREWKRMSMLSRPATHFGNYVANVPTGIMQRSNIFFNGLMESGAVKRVKLDDIEKPVYDEVGKQWISIVNTANGEQLVSAKNEADCIKYAKAAKYGATGSAVYSKASKDLATEVYKTVKEELDGGGDKWDASSNRPSNNLVFKYQTIFKGDGMKNICQLLEKSGIDFSKFKNGEVYDPSLLETVKNGIYKLMEAEDRPFVRNAFVRSLASYCEAHGITDMSKVPQTAIAQATADAYYYTYKNENAIANVVKELKRIPGIGFIADIKIPFVTTVANIGVMAVEHNPLVAGAKAIGAAKAGNTKAVTQNLSKGMTGALITALGYGLANMGLLTGEDDDDKDKVNFLKSIGIRGNSLLGKLDLSQLEPFISLLSFGASLNELENAEGEKSFPELMWAAFSKSADSIYDMDMVQNLAELFNGDKNGYSNSGNVTMDFLTSLILDLPGQMIPGIYQSVVNSIDQKNRYSYSDKEGVEGFAESILYALSYYSGIGRGKLPEKMNALGTSSKGSAFWNAVDEIAYPGKIAQGEATKGGQYLMDLEKKTGKKTMYPDTFSAGKKYTNDDGDEITVGVKETGKFQETYSKTYLGLVDKLMDNKWFTDLDDKTQLAILSNYKSYAKDMAVAEAFKDKGVSYSSDIQKLVNGEERIGEDRTALNKSNVANYYVFKKLLTTSMDDRDYGTIDKLVKSYASLDTNLKNVIDERIGNLSQFKKAAEAGINSESWMTYRDSLKAIQKEEDTQSDGSRLKYKAIIDSGLDDDVQQKLIDMDDNISKNWKMADSVLSQYGFTKNQIYDFFEDADWTLSQKSGEYNANGQLGAYEAWAALQHTNLSEKEKQDVFKLFSDATGEKGRYDGWSKDIGINKWRKYTYDDIAGVAQKYGVSNYTKGNQSGNALTNSSTKSTTPQVMTIAQAKKNGLLK